MLPTRTMLIGLVTLIGLMGCGGSAPPPAQPEASAAPEPSASAPASAPSAAQSAAPAKQEPPPPAKPDIAPPGSSVDRIMQAHFKDALLIREAVIAGKPERAAEPASVFAKLENFDSLPKGWRPFVERMKQAAQRVQDGASPAQTAAATADLGVSCGLCHKQHNGPAASKEPVPEAGTTVASRMRRHVWATERLWEGLAIPSDEAWKAGVKELGREPFPKEVLKEGGVHARSAASDLGKLIATASNKRTVEERAGLYAELLVACGTCHQAMRGH